MNDPGFLGSAETGVSSSLAHNKFSWETAVHVPQALGEGREWKAEIHSGLILPVQRPRKMPKLEAQSFSQPLSLWWSSHELAPAGSSRLLEAAVLITSLQACPLLAGPSAPVWLRVCTVVGAISWVGGIDGIKVHLPGPGRQSPPWEGCCPAHPHTESARNARQLLEHSSVYSLHIGFSVYIPSGDLPSSWEGWDLVSVSNPLCGHFRSSEVVRGKLSIYLCFNGYIKINIF